MSKTFQVFPDGARNGLADLGVTVTQKSNPLLLKLMSTLALRLEQPLPCRMSQIFVWLLKQIAQVMSQAMSQKMALGESSGVSRCLPLARSHHGAIEAITIPASNAWAAAHQLWRLVQLGEFQASR